MPRLGASVHIGDVRAVVNVGSAAVPTVAGSERVKAVAGNEAGQEPRKSRFREHSQKSGPQVGEPGPKMKRAHFTPLWVRGSGWWVVTVVEATWLG